MASGSNYPCGGCKHGGKTPDQFPCVKCINGDKREPYGATAS